MIVNFPPPGDLNDYATSIRRANAREDAEIERRIDHWRRRRRKRFLLLWALQFIVPILIVALIWRLL